jgi:SAM-dependent methyltransferase
MSGVHAVPDNYRQMIRSLNAVHYASEVDYYSSAPLRECELRMVEQLTDDARVLDVGCGAGRVTSQLLSIGIKATGVDLNLAALFAAARRFDRYLAADMVSLPFVAGTFDHIWCLRFSFNALATGLERKSTLTDLWRVCAPGGIVLLEIFNWYFRGRYGLVRLANLVDAFNRRLRWIGQGRQGSPPLPARDILYIANKTSGAAPGFAHLTTIVELRKMLREIGIVHHALFTDDKGVVDGTWRPIRDHHRSYSTWVALKKPA